MAKYDPLENYLRNLLVSINDVTLSFDHINEVLQSNLPYSAYNHRAWWSNEEQGQHVQAHSWLDAGWKVGFVDFNRKSVRFIRLK